MLVTTFLTELLTPSTTIKNKKENKKQIIFKRNREEE